MSKIDITRSFEMQEKAKNRIPGVSQLLSKRPDMFSYGVWPGYFSKAKGAYVWDLDDNRYLDMSIAGIGANVLGYGDPDVDSAVREAISKGTSSSLNCPEEVELADLLCGIHPWAEKVRYARTGGESMAVAIRIARAFTGKDKLAFCGYHGWHDWYLAANLDTENALGEHLISGLNPAGVPKGLKGTAIPFKYNDVEDLDSIFDEQGKEIGTIVMEPIRNQYPTDEFIQKIHSLADKYNCLLVADEISAGFRLNSGGAHLELGLKPDIAVFSKALGNGYPIAAVIGKGDVMEAAQKSFISSTYWTERIGTVAAIATIRKHREKDAAKHLMAIGDAVQEGWKQAAENNNFQIQIGGISPLSHFSFEEEYPPVLKALFIQKMLEREILASTSFYSMYTHTMEHVSEYLDAVNAVFGKIRKILDKGENPEKYLQGKAAVSGFKRLN